MSAVTFPAESHACVLVVDAEADHRVLLELLLRRMGAAEIVVADSVAEAWLALDAQSARYDAVLLGMGWPGTEELDGCRRIGEDPRFADLPVIVMAAQSDGRVMHAAFAAGAADYLPKPIDSMEFSVRVSAAVRLKVEIGARKTREQELAAAMAVLRADLDAAAALERSLLPVTGEVAPGVRIAYCFQPSLELGGDIFNVVALPDGRVMAYLLDVAGHGVAAALTAVAVHRMLVAGADGGVLCDAQGLPRAPGEIAAILNRRFRMEGDSLTYLSLTAALLDGATHEGWVTQAGHPPLVIANGADVRTHDAGDMPIGMFEDARYESHRIALRSATRLVFYSDGVTEAASPSGELFGLARLCDAVRGAHGDTLDALVATVMAAARAHRGQATFADDFALLAVEFA
jgi:sigma-B regulation protein RsbU (phosphoserine phosphatase)